MSSFDRSEFVNELKSLGVEKVRNFLALGHWGWPAEDCAKEWLEHEDKRLSLEAAARDEARSEENLSISRKALSNSERATRVAISAIVLSIIMAMYEIIKWYSSR